MNLIAPVLCIAFAAVLYPFQVSAASTAGDALVLSENPAAGHGRAHGGGRVSQGGQQVHTEHRASAKRTWYLNLHDLHQKAEVLIVQPDGKNAAGALSHGGDGWSFAVDLKPLDGSLDGVFNLYVIDRFVEGGVLTVRAAKANMINHSCSWGHKYKFDDDRLRPRHDTSVPLEIVADDLWDRNFHSRTMSGDTLKVQVLQAGRPAAGARVSFTTGSGWTKNVMADENGTASVQLIRDYYPESWSLFDARKRGLVLVTALVETAAKGVYQGNKFSATKVVATLPWRYYPQRREYSSYAAGLGIAALFAVASGAGIYVYRERRKRPLREVTFDERS